MNKDKADAVLKMKPEDLIPYELVAAALLENTKSQRDDALSRLAAAEAAQADTLKKQAALLAAKDAESAAALKAVQDQDAARDAAKNAAITEMQAYVDACGGTAFAQAAVKQAKRDALAKAKADALAAADKAAADLKALG